MHPQALTVKQSDDHPQLQAQSFVDVLSNVASGWLPMPQSPQPAGPNCNASSDIPDAGSAHGGQLFLQVGLWASLAVSGSPCPCSLCKLRTTGGKTEQSCVLASSHKSVAADCCRAAQEHLLAATAACCAVKHTVAAQQPPKWHVAAFPANSQPFLRLGGASCARHRRA